MSIVNNKKGGIIQIALNLTLAALISGAVLAGTYSITAPEAAKQRVNFKNQTMRALIPDAESFVPLEGKTDWFRAQKGGKTLGYVIPADGRGYGGTIRILVSADTNERVMDYTILSHNETPGLGDRAALPDFRKQFRGKPAEDLIVVKKHEDSHIDALTGATITSRAVTKAVRESVEGLKTFLEGKM